MGHTILAQLKKTGTAEALIWLFALSFFAISAPQVEQHFTLCLFHFLGFHHCPGCGIGRSIGFFLHGDIATSWQMHFLGIPASCFLLYRASSILYKNHIKQLKLN